MEIALEHTSDQERRESECDSTSGDQDGPIQAMTILFHELREHAQAGTMTRGERTSYEPLPCAHKSPIFSIVFNSNILHKHFIWSDAFKKTQNDTPPTAHCFHPAHSPTGTTRTFHFQFLNSILSTMFHTNSSILHKETPASFRAEN